MFWQFSSLATMRSREPNLHWKLLSAENNNELHDLRMLSESFLVQYSGKNFLTMKFKTLNVWFIAKRQEVTFTGMQISQLNRIWSKCYAKPFHKLSWITHINLKPRLNEMNIPPFHVSLMQFNSKPIFYANQYSNWNCMHCQERNCIQNVNSYSKWLRIISFHSHKNFFTQSVSQWSDDDDLKVLRIKFPMKILWSRLKNWIYFSFQNGLE